MLRSQWKRTIGIETREAAKESASIYRRFLRTDCSIKFSLLEREMKKSQMVLIGLLCFGVFLTLLTYTLIAPLLPSELLKRDISSLYNGVIIG